MRYAYKISVGKSEVERSRHRWENNTRMDLKEMRTDHIQMVQDRVQGQALEEHCNG
jgi:hypothetical protein